MASNESELIHNARERLRVAHRDLRHEMQLRVYRETLVEDVTNAMYGSVTDNVAFIITFSEEEGIDAGTPPLIFILLINIPLVPTIVLLF